MAPNLSTSATTKPASRHSFAVYALAASTMAGVNADGHHPLPPGHPAGYMRPPGLAMGSTGRQITRRLAPPVGSPSAAAVYAATTRRISS